VCLILDSKVNWKSNHISWKGYVSRWCREGKPFGTFSRDSIAASKSQKYDHPTVLNPRIDLQSQKEHEFMSEFIHGTINLDALIIEDPSNLHMSTYCYEAIPSPDKNRGLAIRYPPGLFSVGIAMIILATKRNESLQF
jgi:hypothetical protein